MKTVYGQCLSFKEISLSKATKILSQFASADNGASDVVSAYLHRASSAFIELDNLHKELRSKKRHKRQSETGDDSGRAVGNSVQSVETNLGPVKYQSGFGRQSGSQDDGEDGGNSTQAQLNGSVGYEKANMSGGEKQKKNKINKQDKEYRIGGEKEHDGNTTQSEGKKKTKLKEGEHKKLSNNIEVENGGLVDPQVLEIRSKKRHESADQNKLYAEEVKMENRKKRKNEELECRPEDKSGELTEKRKKRKH